MAIRKGNVAEAAVSYRSDPFFQGVYLEFYWLLLNLILA
jgi:hypothetical protein